MKITKKDLEILIREAASEYVWGVKGPDRVANKYQISTLKKIIKEELDLVLEGDDRCTRIAKSKYDVWPSAYASGAVVRCRDGKIWKDLKEEELEEGDGESLRKWFGRKGEKGSKGGWVDCNAPDGDGGYKSCGREEGEKRSKYPSCRPTPGACKEKGKGKSWGKKAAKKESLEMNEELLNIIKEEMEGVLQEMENAYYDFLAEGETLEEAEYQGRKVTLNKPMRGDVKKSKVYVKNEKGNVVKVNFGDPNMKIKKNIPARRKSFRARHNCDNPGPKWKARYWSCKAW